MEEQNHQILSQDELVRQFYAKRNIFMRYIHRLELHWDTAEDIFQEACLRFLKVTGSFPDYLPAAKYLYRIIFNLVMERWRKQHRLLFMENPPEVVCEPEPVWQKDMLLENLRQAVGNLSLKDRQLLTIHLLPDLQIQEKSKLMNLPPSTYRYQVVQITSKLRKQLIPKNCFQKIGFSKPIGGN